MEELGSSGVIFWIAVAASASGMIGTALVYFYGVPRQTDTGGVSFLLLEGDNDADEIARIARFKLRGNLGLTLIFVAFLLQLLGLLLER